MRKLYLILSLIIFLICACSNKPHRIIDYPQDLIFNRDFSMVKDYREFDTHLQKQVLINEQQRIKKQRKIDDSKVLEKQKKEEASTHQDSFYKNIQVIKNPTRVDVLINKQNRLPDNYIPDNLVLLDLPQLDERKHLLREVAYLALKELLGKAKEYSHDIVIVSAYRSYQTQASVYNNYVQRRGHQKADTFSARPGHSEHQSGLAIDVSISSLKGTLTQKFGETAEGLWIAQYAHHFGFIVRYPLDKSHITGYMYEPWHLRYVGVEIARGVFQCQCTYEEYLG